MIVHRHWLQTSWDGKHTWDREGWYLLGLLPLYVRDNGPRRHRRPRR
jgi:hypothetical protein